MMPPLRTPGNASCFGSGFQSATTSPFLAKLRIRNPSELAGSQPQHALLGAYVSCSESEKASDTNALQFSGRRAGIRAQFRPGVKRARPDQAIVIVLLYHVRAPAGYA